MEEIFNPNGTKDTDGLISRSSYARRASWVVRLFPYMEETPLWDIWSTVLRQSNPPAPSIAASELPEQCF